MLIEFNRFDLISSSSRRLSSSLIVIVIMEFSFEILLKWKFADRWIFNSHSIRPYVCCELQVIWATSLRCLKWIVSTVFACSLKLTTKIIVSRADFFLVFVHITRLTSNAFAYKHIPAMEFQFACIWITCVAQECVKQRFDDFRIRNRKKKQTEAIRFALASQEDGRHCWLCERNNRTKCVFTTYSNEPRNESKWSKKQPVAESKHKFIR